MNNFALKQVANGLKTATKGLCLSVWLTLFINPLTIAATYSVSDAESLKLQLETVKAGDTVLLLDGEYSGHFEIHQPITLTGEGSAIIDAQGSGRAIAVFSSGVSLKNLTIQNWGGDLYEFDAGVFIHEQAERVHIESSHLQGDGFGIYAENSKHIIVNNNIIAGNNALYKLDRGDGVYLKGVDVSVLSLIHI